MAAAQRALLGELAETEAGLAALHAEVERRVRAASRGRRLTPAQREEVARRETQRVHRDRHEIIAEGIRRASRRGGRLDRALYERIFGSPPPAARFATDADSLFLASERIRGQISFRGLSLSSRLHAADADTLERMRLELERAHRAGEG